jgi:2-polyprenyl-3-methyl-5-hydroxy-6-metoxy-1,4-benzoquinol methylase
MQRHIWLDQPIYSTIRPCPLCSCKNAYRLIDLKYALFEDNPLSPVMHLATCADCGFVFYDTQSTEADFDEFYSDHYLIHSYCSSLHDYQADHNAYRHLAGLLRDVGINEVSRIVDVGCGRGQLLHALISYGFNNVAGIDLFSDYIKDLNAEGLEAYTGSAFDIPEHTKNADLLIYKHIFEHFFDLHSAAKAAHKNIVPGGHLFIAVPDATQYNNFREYSFLHYMNLEHINHFDLPHIESLFSSYGMSMEYTDTQLLDISEDYPVPIMSCLFRKTSDSGPADIEPDFNLAEDMLHWLEDNKSLDTTELKNLAASQHSVYVWGISLRTSMYLAMSSLKSCNIKAFLDIDPRKQNKTLLNKKILSPDMLKHCSEKDTVVIGVGPSSRTMSEMLCRQGFKGGIIRLV